MIEKFEDTTFEKNKQKVKDLDWGKNLVGNVKQEFVIEKDFMEKIGWGKFLATNVKEWILETNKREITKFEIHSIN